MRSIVLLPLDGSDKDRRAIAVAAAVAELASAGVRIVRVLETPSERPSESSDAFGSSRMTRATREEHANRLRAVARRLDRLTQSPATWKILDGADVAAALLTDIDVHDPRFVIMATGVPRAAGGAIHGRVVDRLLRESPRPVVLVPARADHLAGRRLRLRRVLVPIDGSTASLRVVAHLLTLPRARELECVLIHAVDPHQAARFASPVLSPLRDADEAEVRTSVPAEVAETALNAVAEQLRRLGATVEVRVVESDDPGAVILDAVRNDLVELIAMTTHGASGIAKFLLGSVAEIVVRGSEIPVMLTTR